MVDYSEVTLTPSEVLASGGGYAQPSIFVAYRMNESRSRAFRASFGDLAASHPFLRKFRIVDGHVSVGGYWAREIRDKIRKSSLVVADVTGPSKEVLFEAGFAYGLRKPILPVVADPANRDDVPRWLTPIQIGTYESSQALRQVLTSAVTHATRDDIAKPPKPPDAVPGMAVWIPIRTWANTAFDQFRVSAAQGSLKVVALDIPSDLADADGDVIQNAACANFLFGCLEGTSSDSLIHFVCGAIMAKPTASISKSKMDRRIVLLTIPGEKADDLVADSARKCAEVRVIDIQGVIRQTKAVCDLHDRWANR